MKRFIIGRIKSLRYALKGFFLLIHTEDAIIVHSSTFVLFTILGIYLEISHVQWMFQIMAFSVLFVTEGLNTAIEKMCDFVHPDFHKKIGMIKDISAGAVTFAVLLGAVVLALIYVPLFVQ